MSGVECQEVTAIVRPYERLNGFTIPDAVQLLAREYGDREAVVGPEGRLDYAHLGAEVDSMAASLAQLGMTPGAKVGVFLPNGTRWVVSALAIQTAGLTVVPINTWSRRDELADLTHRSHLEYVIHGEPAYGRDPVDELVGSGVPAEQLLCWNATDRRAGWVGNGTVDAAIEVAEDAIGLLVPTSGSTSRPKLVPLRQDRLLHNGHAIGRRLRLTVGDRLWLGAPLFFSYGCANALPVVLTHGLTLCLQERVQGDRALEMIERERCTVYYGFGPTTAILTSAETFGTRDLSSLRTGTTGFSEPEKRLATDGLGITAVSSVYGMTEAYGHSAMTDPGDPIAIVLETQGKVLPTQEMRIVDEDDRPADAGAVGAIQLRGCVTTEYFEDPVATAEAFTEDGWLRTGDLGFIDVDDRLHFVERAKDVLKINGINISPAEIERLLCEHDAVDAAYVVGHAAPTGETVVIAYVVPHAEPADASTDDSLAEELRAFVRVNAASYKVPGVVHLISRADVPLTTTGKVNKRSFLDRAAAPSTDARQ